MTVSPRRTLLAVVGMLACVLGSLTVATPAAAAPVFRPGSRVITGDLTGDGIPDRTTLGIVGTHCAYQLVPGLGGGRFGAPVTARLPVRNAVPDDGVFVCPDLGTVLRSPRSVANQLAVTWFDFGPYEAPRVQTFTGFGSAVRNTGGFDGPYQPSMIASQDFDGDGYGDIWETTDQGGGFTAFVGRSSTHWHGLYGTPSTRFADPQFFDLNHAGGTDILVTWTEFGDEGSGVAAVDGRTGAVRVLASHSSATDDRLVGYDVAVVDVNHDAYPDLRVTSTSDTGTTTTDRFVNRSQGGRWYFQKLAS